MDLDWLAGGTLKEGGGSLRGSSGQNEDDDEAVRWVEKVISQNRNLIVPSADQPKARKRPRTPEGQIQRSKPWDRNQSYFEKRPEADPPSVQAGVVEEFHDLCAHDCPICMSSMTRSKVSVLLPCFHRFCYPCIKAWVVKTAAKGKPSCPSCRQQCKRILYSIRSSTSYKTKFISRGSAFEEHSQS